MIFKKRTHTCGELTTADAGKNVTLNGWVSQVRDLGGLIFINLRDRYGITQVIFNPENPSAYESAGKLRNEFVISVSGEVQKRSSPNPGMKTGEIEVAALEMDVLNASEVPPFVVEEEVKASEELRLKFRYLDLRRKKLADNLMIRSSVYQIVHKYFEKNGFIEVETPMLMKSTPEGARDYLVPSRVHNGKFYALPQSPQTYKQILMVSGLDRYVQICKCFRDEDLRADRQPEFTQVDLEMSFVDQDDVFMICEGMIRDVWKGITGQDPKTPFKIINYDEAMASYGTDKPDLRIKGELKIIDVSEILRGTEFKVFSEALSAGGIVAGIKLPSQEVTRKMIDTLTEYVKAFGFGGLAHFKFSADDAVQSPAAKFMTPEGLVELRKKFEAKAGDTVFIISGEKKKVLTALGQLRLKLAEKFSLTDESKFEFLWVNDFPLFHFNDEQQRFEGEHHIFTMPKDENLGDLDSRDRKTIENIRASSYDLVCNGNELGSGSIRIHKRDIQKKVFDIIGLSDEEAKQKFGFVLEAFTYGAPPHGGFAFGFDRIIALLCGTKDIRDTIAFPKTTSAMSLMDDCPSPVDKNQLDELGLRIIKN